MLFMPGKKVMVLASNSMKKGIPIGSIGYTSYTTSVHIKSYTRPQLKHMKEYGILKGPAYSQASGKIYISVIFYKFGKNGKPCIKRKQVGHVFPSLEVAPTVKYAKTYLKAVNKLPNAFRDKNMVVLCGLDEIESIENMSFNQMIAYLYSLILNINYNSYFNDIRMERKHGHDGEHAESVLDRVNLDNIIITKNNWKVIRALTRDINKDTLYKSALCKEHIIPTIIALRSMIGQIEKATIMAQGTQNILNGHTLPYTSYFMDQPIRRCIIAGGLTFGNTDKRDNSIANGDALKRILRSLSTSINSD